MQTLTKPLKTIFPLVCCAALALSCNTAIPAEKNEPEAWNQAQPLYPIYSSSFLLGNIVSPGDIGGQRFNLLKRHFNTATAENHMKPNALAPSSPGGAYRFSAADAMVDAVLDAGLKMHGHTLVWHQQTPSWMNSGAGMNREQALSNLTNHVTTVVTHYKDKLISWDVVNEAMRDGLSTAQSNGDWKNCLRQDSPWYTAIGPDYIEEAFKAARAADPQVKLYYNDYSLNNAAKAQAVYNMVCDINTRYANAAGRPLIDGIGMQSHHHLGASPETVAASINLFSKAGVEIAISELDIQAFDARGGNTAFVWNEDAAQRQAQQYAAMFRIFQQHAEKISRVTFWGLDDRTSWRSSSHPVLFDKDYKTKPAFYAVANPGQY